jgi:hypothetical protein
MTVEEAQQNEFMGPCRRAQQPNGVQVAEAAQQVLVLLGQQATSATVRQLGQQGNDLFGSLPKRLAR